VVGTTTSRLFHLPAHTMGLRAPPARSRSPQREGRSAGGPSLLGNISVGLSSVGQPVATLTHPSGDSCQVCVFGARILSWKFAGMERLALPPGGEGESGGEGGLRPCGLQEACGLGAEAWTLERMQGDAGAEDEVVVSLFAEVGANAAGGGVSVPIAARQTVSLSQDRLRVELEVANAVDEEGPLKDDPASRVRFGALGFRTAWCAPPSNLGAVGAASVEAALREFGLDLQLEGFTATSFVEAGVGVASACTFDVGAPTAVELGAGEVVTGSITFQRKLDATTGS